MNHMYIGLRMIMFRYRISTLPGILTQIMSVLGSFWELRCGNILSKIDSTSKLDNLICTLYSLPLQLRQSSVYSEKHHIIIKIIMLLLPYH